MWKMGDGVGLTASPRDLPGFCSHLSAVPPSRSSRDNLGISSTSLFCPCRTSMLFDESSCFSWFGSLSNSGSVACRVGGGAAVAARRVGPARSLSSSFTPASCRCSWTAPPESLRSPSLWGWGSTIKIVCFPALRLTWRILRHGVLWLDGTN